VFATWVTDRVGNGPVKLGFPILWRGTPGWYLLAAGRVADSFDGARTYQTIEYGNIRLTLDYGAGDAVAINGRELDLGTDGRRRCAHRRPCRPNVAHSNDVAGVGGADRAGNS